MDITNAGPDQYIVNARAVSNAGGPAFPGMDYVSQNGKVNPAGMTLRDYFAGQATDYEIQFYCAELRVTPVEARWHFAAQMIKARGEKPW